MNKEISKPFTFSWLQVATQVFKFFASLKLAIFVIVSLMISMAVGTFLESAHSTETARLAVYETAWFSFIMILLGVNVASAAIDRYPWKIKHAGFVTTHVGIILILIGSFVTQQKMIDGQMMLAEGETDYRITLPLPIVYFFSEATQRDWILPIEKHAFKWEGNKRLRADRDKQMPVELKALTYYPKAYVDEYLEPASEGPASVKIRIHNSFLDQELQLIENHETLGKISMGPAIFSFSDVALQASGEVLEEAQNYLEFQFEKINVRVPVSATDELPKKYALEGTSYAVTVEQIFKRAVVDGKNLMENPTEGAPENPAVVLLLEGEGLQEKHSIFTNFPDFPTRHGMKVSDAGVKIFYRKPNAGSKGETHELRFIRHGNDARLQYQIQDGFKVTTHDAILGEDVSLGWMDLKFNILEYHPHAKQKREYQLAPNASQNESVVSAIQLELSASGESKTVWLGQGFLETVEFGDDMYHLLYGQRRLPTEFKLTLDDFRMEEYPGTNQPASFESDVELSDDAAGVKKKVTISMNEPLAYKGFNIYQSGYQMEPGEPEVSIFSVGRDPGIPLKYIGTIVMVLGIVIMFFTRKFSTRAGKIG